jgi:hypothetical protein
MAFLVACTVPDYSYGSDAVLNPPFKAWGLCYEAIPPLLNATNIRDMKATKARGTPALSDPGLISLFLGRFRCALKLEWSLKGLCWRTCDTGFYKRKDGKSRHKESENEVWHAKSLAFLYMCKIWPLNEEFFSQESRISILFPWLHVTALSFLLTAPEGIERSWPALES